MGESKRQKKEQRIYRNNTENNLENGNTKSLSIMSYVYVNQLNSLITRPRMDGCNDGCL